MTALVDQRSIVTFGELDRMVNDVAVAALDAVANGVGAAGEAVDRWGPFVPLVVDRSAESVAAVLGMVRAGLPFVPIDHTSQREAVVDLFRRVGNPRVAVLTRPQYADILPEPVRAVLPASRHSDVVPPAAVHHDGPGVLIFSSGSTGSPKAVVRPWRAFDAVGPANGSSASVGGNRVGMTLPLSFSGGLNQLACLRAGNSLHIVDPARMSTRAMFEWLVAQGVTEMHGVTSVIAAVLRAAQADEALNSLRCSSLGGEATDWAAVDLLRRVGAVGATVISSLSSSESGPVLSCTIGPDHPLGEGPLPLGLPINGVQVRVEHLDGPGSPGQLLSSNPIALGFLDDPELEASRFSIDDDGTRWLRSSDLVRVGDDGLYYHVARADDVVKVNGRLVNPGTAELVLRRLPGIADAAVIPSRRPSGRTYLVAHIELADHSLEPGTVMRALRAEVAADHVPAMLVAHDQLPRNDRGKVDRTMLLSTRPRRWRVRKVSALRENTEQFVASQLAGLIDLDEVDPDDDVWDLGLDSLSAVEFCALVEVAGFGALAPPELLEHRTVAAIAARLDRTSTLVRASSPVVDLTGGTEGVALFVLPGGGGTALAFRALAQELVGRVGPLQRMLVIEPRGLHSRGRVARSFERYVADAVADIESRLAPGEPCVVVGFSAGAVVGFEVCCRLHASGRAVRLVMLDAAPRPADDHAGHGTDGAPRRGAARWAVPVDRWRHRLRIPRYVVWPGRPRHDTARYRAFQIILGPSLQRYRPPVEPVAFPVVLVHCSRPNLEHSVAALAVDRRCVVAGGEHLTVLWPPHVGTVADAVAAELHAAGRQSNPAQQP